MLVYLGSGILAVCRAFIGLVIGLVEGLVSEIPKMIQAQIEGAKQAWQGLMGNLKDLADLIWGWVKEAREWFRDPAGRVVRAVTPQPVKEALEVVPKPIKEAAKGLSNAAVQSIPGLDVITRMGELIDIIQGKPKAPATTPCINPQANQVTTQVSQLPSQPLPISQFLAIPNINNNNSQQIASNFSPVLHLQTHSQIDPENLVNLLTDRLARDYNRYIQEQLA